MRERIRFSSRAVLRCAWMSNPSTVSWPDRISSKRVDRADQRGLAGAGRSADHHDLAALDLGVDVTQRVIVAIPFVDVG